MRTSSRWRHVRRLPIGGFQSIHESDLQLVPDISTVISTSVLQRILILVFDIDNPRNGEIYGRDPRQVAKKAEKYCSDRHRGHRVFFAPEAEFYIDDVRDQVKQNRKLLRGRLRRKPAQHGPSKGGTLPTRPRTRAGTSSSTPLTTSTPTCATTSCSSSRKTPASKSSAATTRSAPPARGEINYKFDDGDAADDILKFKYIVKNTALEWGKVATFMPKPLMGDNEHTNEPNKQQKKKKKLTYC